jgi:hypothetical protein
VTEEMLLAVLALLVSGLAALYARWSAREARKANDIGRLNALLALRGHYLALMERQERLAKTLGSVPSGLRAAEKAYADLDGKLREVSVEIDTHHVNVVGGRT